MPNGENDPRPHLRAHLVRTALVAIVASAIVWAGATGQDDPIDAASGKITICHRTHATTNPYRLITVNQNAVQTRRHGSHTNSTSSSNPAVFDANFTYAPNNKIWGDVIPGTSDGGGAFNGSSQIALNWTPAGRAIFFGPQCAAMSARRFYDSEVAAGVAPQAVIDDLNEQEANEDIALLAALGGKFTLAGLDSWETAISITTKAATSVTETTAQLHGDIDLGATSSVSSFEWGTDPSLVGASSRVADQGTVTGPSSVALTPTGLTPSTTYFFRVIATTNAGTDTEGIHRGEILSFTTAAASSTTTVPSSTAPPTTSAPTTTSVASTTTSPTTAPSSTTSPSTTPPSTSPPSTTTPPDTTVPTTTSPSTTTGSTSTSTTAPATAPTTSVTPTTTLASTTTAASTTTPLPPTTTPPGSTSTSTTTTAPVSNTLGTVATTSVVPPTLGRLSGIVWLDRNGDAQVDADEVPLPGTTVTAILEGRPAVSTSTDRSGRYSMSSLPLGRHRVIVREPGHGISASFDDDGVPDWVTTVEVGASQLSANFAGRALGELVGSPLDVPDLEMSGTTVSCHWWGVDEVFETDDDVDFTAPIGSDGSFDIPGVPTGRFSCAGSVASNGRQLRAEVELTSASLTTVTLQPSGAVATTGPVTTDAATTVALTGNLPATGGNSRTSLRTAMLLVVAGLALVGLARRHRPGTSPID